MKKRGLFITFEGTDGVGKSTHVRLVAAWLNNMGLAPVVTREPGGGTVAEQIRGILLDPRVSIEGLTELFLYEAARVEHVEKVIRPALASGKIVLCDRFTDSTLAYQGAARGLAKAATLLNTIATNGLKPDLTILLTIDPAVGYQKALNREQGADRLEGEGLAFQHKVHRGFLALAKREPRRIKGVVVQNQIEATQRLIRALIEKKLHGHYRTPTSASLSR